MFAVAAAGVAAIEIYYAFHAEVREPSHLPIGLAILFLAALPGLLWARRGQATLPVFEVLLLTTANAYALPLLNGHRELIFYTPEDIATAGLCVILFQAVAIGVYEATRGRASTHPFWTEEVINRDVGRWLSYGIALNTVYVLLTTFSDLVPVELNSVLRAVSFGIGIVCTFISARRLGEGQMSRGERLFFILNLSLQCAGMLVSLYLVSAVSMLILGLVGYVSGSGRLPLVTSVFILGIFAILHNGKSEMRSKYWDGGYGKPTLSAVPVYFSEWFSDGLKNTVDQSGETMATKLIDRTSLFHLMCLVVSTTPSAQPFLLGETYRDIPAQFVPRILWAGKPLGHVSTSKLAVYYGLQTEEETATTTIGFGMLTEAYANFGWLGVVGLAAFLGFLIKRVQCWARHSPIFSYGGITLVILLAWSFQVEFTLSIWLASLYQACVAVLLIPFILRRLLGR
jgi:hypothetical protein